MRFLKAQIELNVSEIDEVKRDIAFFKDQYLKKASINDLDGADDCIEVMKGYGKLINLLEEKNRGLRCNVT